MSGCIGVLNAGSSSIKFALYSASGDVDLLFRGQVEGIGASPHLNVNDAKGGTVIERAWPAHGFNHEAAAREILTTAADLFSRTPVTGIGHRVVHGGMRFDAPIRLDRDTLEALAELEPLRRCISPTTWPRSAQSLTPLRIFRRSPALIRRFTAASHASRNPLLCLVASPKPAFEDTAFTACPTNISYRGCTLCVLSLRPDVPSWLISATAPACAL